jgi:hypothetical protein
MFYKAAIFNSCLIFFASLSSASPGNTWFAPFGSWSLEEDVESYIYNNNCADNFTLPVIAYSLWGTYFTAVDSISAGFQVKPCQSHDSGSGAGLAFYKGKQKYYLLFSGRNRISLYMEKAKYDYVLLSADTLFLPEKPESCQMVVHFRKKLEITMVPGRGQAVLENPFSRRDTIRCGFANRRLEFFGKRITIHSGKNRNELPVSAPVKMVCDHMEKVFRMEGSKTTPFSGN